MYAIFYFFINLFLIPSIYVLNKLYPISFYKYALQIALHYCAESVFVCFMHVKIDLVRGVSYQGELPTP